MVGHLNNETGFIKVEEVDYFIDFKERGKGSYFKKSPTGTVSPSLEMMEIIRS